MPEYMDIIDEDNRIIGKGERNNIIKNKLLHRGSSIFLFNSKHELFIHKRTSTKAMFPSCYDLLINGGVWSGESYEQAAIRELEEEVGVTGVKLEPLFKLRLDDEIDSCLLQIFSCVYDGKITQDKTEMVTGKFVTLEELKQMIKKHTFLPGSLKVFQKYLKEEKW